jgi:hypothetical protein
MDEQVKTRLPGKPASWLQRRSLLNCWLFGHQPTHDERLALTRCARCGLGLALDESPSVRVEDIHRGLLALKRRRGGPLGLG